MRRRAPLFAIAATLIVVVMVLGLVIGTAIRPDGRGGSPAARDAAPPLPAVEPMELIVMAPADARVANAAQPFVEGRFPAAAPFRFTGDSTAIARATDCLAAALLYEAGDDADGQRAVAQVVLNRVRHPAFPASVCGVVFQGSERATGCQFTFTCDGALARRYSDPAWQRARGIAIDALNGAVDARVGLATHYHTDWVRPYWSSSLDKLAQVGTHLFFRWRGFWGTPNAFLRNLGGQEPAIARMTGLSAVHAAAAGLPFAPTPADQGEIATASAEAVRTVIPRRERALGDTIILTLERGMSADAFPAMAEAACGTRSYCKVMGWSNPALAPESEAMSDLARAAMSFSYLRDEGANLERALWNCEEYARENRAQCMRR